MSPYKFINLVHLENPVPSESMKLQTNNEPTLFEWFRTNYKYGMWPSGSSSVWQLNRFVHLPLYAWHVLFVLPTTQSRCAGLSMSCPWQQYPITSNHTSITGIAIHVLAIRLYLQEFVTFFPNSLPQFFLYTNLPVRESHSWYSSNHTLTMCV
jgi:hypothetical protein